MRRNSTWLLHEAFCLSSQSEIFHPYEKHHSTVKDACQLAEKLQVKNLILYHTEDQNILKRKELYSKEGGLFQRRVICAGRFASDTAVVMTDKRFLQRKKNGARRLKNLCAVLSYRNKCKPYFTGESAASSASTTTPSSIISLPSSHTVEFKQIPSVWDFCILADRRRVDRADITDAPFCASPDSFVFYYVSGQFSARIETVGDMRHLKHAFIIKGF